MFDISAHNIGDGGITGYNRNEVKWDPEAFVRDIISSPQVLAGMSREMRTEMNAIVAFTFLLNKKEYSDDEREEFSRHIYNSCEKIISLFDNFLDLAIIDTGNSSSEQGTCSIYETINDLYSEIREILRQERYKDVIFVSDNQASNNTKYLIDTNRVSRVIRSLFQNALNNTKSGYIKAGYEIRNDKFTFRMIDSGQGFLKNKEFLHGQELSKPLSLYNDISTAVNIAFSRKLVQLMGGSIWIGCNGPEGSAIYFSVPVSRELNTADTPKHSNTMSTI